MNSLEARGVAVARGGRRILDGVNLKVEPGVVMAMAGPNGSGKSTLLRALAGIWPVSDGSVALDGKPIGALGRRVIAQRIAFVAQDNRLDFAFSVAEIVAMGRYPHRGRFERATSADRCAIEEAMESCGVSELRTRAVNTLSGGERQRVVIARSLAVQPEFILLDEPTANLDVEHAIRILDLCAALARAGKAVVVATHDLNAVVRYTSQAVLIESGRIAFSGPRSEIVTTRTLEEVFGVRAELLASADGSPVYVFHRKDRQ
jgi:iron complex transport system ATP-binding protein